MSTIQSGQTGQTWISLHIVCRNLQNSGLPCVRKKSGKWKFIQDQRIVREFSELSLEI